MAALGSTPESVGAASVGNAQSYFPISQPISPQAYAAYAHGGLQSSLPPVSSPQVLISSQPPFTSAAYVPSAAAAAASQHSPLTQIPVYPTTLPQTYSDDSQTPQPSALNDAPFHPVYNFDLASMNFGNHYGALEFGMLGHISSGALASSMFESPSALDQENVAATGLVSSSVPSPGYVQPVSPANYAFPDHSSGMTDWQSGAAPSSVIPDPDMSRVTSPSSSSLSPPFNDGAGGGMTASGSSVSTPQGYSARTDYGALSDAAGYANSPTTLDGSSLPTQSTSGRHVGMGHAQVRTASNRQPAVKALALPSQQAPDNDGRDASFVYDAVKEPYSYTTGFHALTEFLARRFPQQMTIRIAKALASIRPSFIACAKTLNQRDLVFQEKCFQRALLAYENFINSSAPPTIVCRRTGEVAAVGDEFCILTGWSKDVLLGRQPNRNINFDSTNGGSGSSGGSSRGTNTPRMPPPPPPSADAPGGGGNPQQPVFLAELLDQDSVIEFYEDFAKLAFGDSRGSVMRRCKLVQYKTAKDEDDTNSERGGGYDQPGGSSGGGGGGGGSEYNHGGTAAAAAAGIVGIGGSQDLAQQLETRDGMIESILCWTVRRDAFDMPMMIVMSVSFIASISLPLFCSYVLPFGL
jgi:hypothetical protein